MPYIKNPNYNPNDPKSQRYVFQADNMTSAYQTPAVNMSVAPKQTVPKIDVMNNPLFSTPTPTETKTSTPSLAVAPKPAPPTPNMTPAPNMSVAPNQTPANLPTHTVMKGDTLGAIAQRSGTTVQELQRLNPQYAANPNLIVPGQVIKLPGGGTAPTAPNMTPAIPPAPGTPGAPPAPPAPQAPTSPTEPTTPTPTVPQTGDPTTDEAFKTLAEKAGAAGMKLEDYLSLVNKQSTPTKEESDAIRNKLGIPDLVDTAFGKPEKTTVELYREQYEMSGLKDVKDSIKKLDADIAQKRSDLVKATGDLYNNPWISQSTRSGRLGNLQRIALADIENVVSQKQQYLDLYDQGITEIEDSIKRSVFDTGLDRDLTVDKLNYLLTEAERDEQFAQRAIEKRALRYAPDFLGAQPKKADEGYTLGKDEIRFDSKGNEIARGMGSGSGEGGKIVKINGVDYMQDANGNLTLPEVPSTPASPAQLEAVDSKIALIDSILNNSALDAVVGPYKINRGNFGPFDIAKRQDVSASIAQLVDQETLSSLLALKAQGGTLGAISEKELQILQSSATKISKWADPDHPGEYKIDEKSFKAELNRIKESSQRLKQALAGQGSSSQTLDQYYQKATPEQRNKILEYKQKFPNDTDDEIMQTLGFKKESQTSLNGGSNEIKKIASAIGQFETGGNYSKRGPVVSSGQYKGERALGKYQIMPGNLPQWSREALGRVVTEQEFMSNPKIQDAIAEYKMGKILQQHGTLENVASVWFSGQPLANAGNRKDDLGTTVPQYVKNVRSIYNNFG